MDWGDGTTSEWNGPHQSGQPITMSHTWSSPGAFDIKGKAKDIYGEESEWSNILLVTILDNNPPTNPTISGPNSGKPGITYSFTFISSDPEEEDVSYYIKWGDGTEYNWSSFQPSGESYSENYEWSTQGTYTIESKAKDIHGTESDWGTLTINMPRYKNLQNTLLLRLWDGFLNEFPLFRYILGLH